MDSQAHELLATVEFFRIRQRAEPGAAPGGHHALEHVRDAPAADIHGALARAALPRLRAQAHRING
jgi:hypothetical protein